MFLSTKLEKENQFHYHHFVYPRHKKQATVLQLLVNLAGNIAECSQVACIWRQSNCCATSLDVTLEYCSDWKTDQIKTNNFALKADEITLPKYAS